MGDRDAAAADNMLIMLDEGEWELLERAAALMYMKPLELAEWIVRRTLRHYREARTGRPN